MRERERERERIELINCVVGGRDREEGGGSSLALVSGTMSAVKTPLRGKLGASTVKEGDSGKPKVCSLISFVLLLARLTVFFFLLFLFLFLVLLLLDRPM